MLGGSKVYLGPRSAGNKSLLSYRAGHGITGYGGYCPSSESIPIPIKEGPSGMGAQGVSGDKIRNMNMSSALLTVHHTTGTDQSGTRTTSTHCEGRGSWTGKHLFGDNQQVPYRKARAENNAGDRNGKAAACFCFHVTGTSEPFVRFSAFWRRRRLCGAAEPEVHR